MFDKLRKAYWLTAHDSLCIEEQWHLDGTESFSEYMF